MRRQLWLLVVLPLVLVMHATGASAQIPQAERDALVALYNGTGGSSWYINSGWLGPAGTECTWFGVTCDASGLRVDELVLDDNNLVGRLPAELLHLESLTFLDLSGNQLTGPVPAWLGTIPMLYYIDLQANGFTGAIPSQLGSLGNLEYLYLANNDLSGTIPTQLGDLRWLYMLSLSANDLSGTLPPELGDLSSLFYLWASRNSLSGTIPPELGNISYLGQLSLYDNFLTGTIPTELRNLTNLNTLSLSTNLLTGTIPAWIGTMSQLTRISLWANDFSGTIPPELGNLTLLEDLYVSQNALTGTIPRELGGLESLQELTIYDNQLSGTIPPELGNVSTLQRLSASGNALTGTIPAWLGDLPDMTSISLWGNQLSGTIPPEIGDLSGLHTLYLSSNQLSGTIPPSLGSLSNLKWISLSANQLEGTIPREFGSLASLEVLYASRNSLSGTIPYQLGSLDSLYEISVYDNQLSGTIPPELGNLGNLELLYLSENALSGTIPHQLGNLSSLWVLALHQNRLGGSIPRELGYLSGLYDLYLSGNRLTGSVPGTLAQLDNLEDMYGLDLRYNGLYTTDAALQSFLDGKQIDADWESSQTIAPTDVTVGAIDRSSVAISWTPIVYTWDSGWYRVLGGTSPGGPYQLLGGTSSKLDSGLTVTGLQQGTTYHFVVQTVTEPHGWNQNRVESDRSVEVSAITSSPDDCVLTCTAVAPATAEVGETVAFAGTATATNCAATPSFAWAFGDGQSSTHHSPTHAYGSQGTYAWSVTVSAADQRCTRTGSITVFTQGSVCGNSLCEAGETAWTCAVDCGLGAGETGRSGESATRSAVPAAVGGQGGVGGTYWVSEAMLHNPGSRAATYTMVFTPDDDPGAVLTAGSRTLAAGGAQYFDNFVNELFGVSDNGCVRVTSDEPLMLVSRTFNDQPQGSYGQFLGAVSTSRALGVGDRAFLPGLSEDSAFRSNVILQEVAGLETEVRLSVFRSDGSAVGATTISVPAFTKSQQRLLNLGFSGLSSGYAAVEVTQGGHIVAMASVVDQSTGDAMTIDALHQSQAQLALARAKAQPAAGSLGVPTPAAVATASTGFTWSPRRPIVGETVQFTDLSSGDGLAWSWSFGDGGQSNAQHPTHVYAAAGSYSVTLSVASTGVGSWFVQETLTVDAIPATAVHYMLAVVARLPGEAGTRWRSDVWLLNPFAASQQVWLEYYPEGGGGRQRQRLVVRAGEQLCLDDVVGSHFSEAGDGKGGLHVYAAQGIFVNSRTYNLGTGGTFGQAIPSLGGGDLLSAGDTGVLLKLKSTSTRRCNVGFTEFEGVATRVQVRLYNVAGTSVALLQTKTYDVSAYQNLQVNRIMHDMGMSGEYESVLAEVSVLSGGSVYVYASNVDSRTGDGEFIPAMVR